MYNQRYFVFRLLGGGVAMLQPQLTVHTAMLSLLSGLFFSKYLVNTYIYLEKSIDIEQ